MKRQTWFCLIVYLTLHTASVVRSEYTWNGSEWVWTESAVDQKSQSSTVDEVEGSGDDDYSFTDEEEDNYNDDYDEGSGMVDEPNNKKTPFQTNNNPSDPYNSWQDPVRNNPDPYETYNPSGNRNQDNNFNSHVYSATAQPPYNEVDKEDKGIYIDPPVQYPIPTTTSEVPQPKSPNQNNGPKSTNRSTSFFAQPGTLAAVIGGAVVGLLCAILCVMFVVYRMRKKDEGSYALDEPKRSPTVNAYAKHPSREFYA